MTTETTDRVTIEDDGATTDPEAPYGRFANGKPRKSPPKDSKSSGGGRRTAAAPKPPRPKGGKAPNFTKMITGAIGSVGAVVSAAGFRRRSRTVVADGMAVQMAAKPLAEGLNEVAQVSPALQRILTQAGPALPFATLAYALLELGAQIAANHGKQLPGFEVYDPDALVEAAEHQARQAAAQQQPTGGGQSAPTPADMPQQQRDHAFAAGA